MRRECGFSSDLSLSQSVTEVRVHELTHPFTQPTKDIPHQKVLANYAHYLDVTHKLLVI